MKTKALRIAIPIVVAVVISVGFVVHSGVGTLSAFGWESISVLCPLGALGTMLASKILVPRAVISLVVAVIAIVILGSAFCAWVCPIPVVSKLRNLFHKKPLEGEKGTAEKSTLTEAASEILKPHSEDKPLTADELKIIKGGCSEGEACAFCVEKRGKIDSRHVILGGSLLTAAIFGFPAFCLVCPIGLAFAVIFLIILLFSGGDVTWSVVLVPVLLVVEVVLFKKWCSKICPLSAFMSLIGKANRTFRPTIDDGACLETSKGLHCGVCSEVCEQGINPRHPELGSNWSECTKCRACIEACPGKAITMPFLPKKTNNVQAPPVLSDSEKNDENRKCTETVL